MTPYKLRRSLYRAARLTGDVQALASGDPHKVVRRAGNKLLGRTVVRRMWLR
jgi:hypothetical protein